MLKFSEQIDQLSTALAKAQGELENADKNSANPHFRSKYADLAEILNTVRPTLSKYGLAVSQHPAFSEGVVYVTTLMSHTSGQWMQSCFSSPAQKADIQGIMACTTYLRRGALAAVAGIGQEDDDGETAAGRGKTGMEVMAKARNEKIKDVLDNTIVESLRNAADLKALAAAWGKIDVGIRHEYAAVKDAVKAKLGEVK